MALRISTAISNAMTGIGRASIVGKLSANTISFDNASKEIRDSGNGFLTAGFLAGDQVTPFGTSNNNTEFDIVSAAAGVLVTEVAPTTEAAGTIFSLAAAQGVTNGGVRDLLRNGVLRVYSGSQPTTPDDAVAGTLLLEVTVDGETFVHGSAANGLNWADAVDRVMSKAAAETWKAAGEVNGTAAWFRFSGNPADTGLEDTTKVLMRIDGTVGMNNADLLLVSTAIVLDDVYYINSAAFTMPMQYGAV